MREGDDKPAPTTEGLGALAFQQKQLRPPNEGSVLLGGPEGWSNSTTSLIVNQYGFLCYVAWFSLHAGHYFLFMMQLGRQGPSGMPAALPEQVFRCSPIQALPYPPLTHVASLQPAAMPNSYCDLLPFTVQRCQR